MLKKIRIIFAVLLFSILLVGCETGNNRYEKDLKYFINDMESSYVTVEAYTIQGHYAKTNPDKKILDEVYSAFNAISKNIEEITLKDYVELDNSMSFISINKTKGDSTLNKIKYSLHYCTEKKAILELDIYGNKELYIVNLSKSNVEQLKALFIMLGNELK